VAKVLKIYLLKCVILKVWVFQVLQKYSLENLLHSRILFWNSFWRFRYSRKRQQVRKNSKTHLGFLIYHFELQKAQKSIYIPDKIIRKTKKYPWIPVRIPDQFLRVSKSVLLKNNSFPSWFDFPREWILFRV